ncbi:MAG: Rieske 2Fe-2S domain-containing protein [candidate division Zixibacteria bacterium]|nr:Rieske 2Fe-2S domain-containing protein [candidate division Zixibacteria bacterium]
MTTDDTKTPGGAPISRRGFFDLALGGGVIALLGAILYPLTRFVIPPESPEAVASQVVAAKIGDLTPNSGKIFRFGKDPALLVLTKSGEYRAFTAICTHLDCTVQYRGDLERIWCACHNGNYDLNGNNVSGPPPLPLTQYNVTVRGDQIIVSKA